MEAFERVKVVGRGSHGLVTLCKRVSDGKSVILKEVSIDTLTLKEKEVTLNEVRVLSKLNHPNVIAYYDSFVQNSTVNIIMEYANKGSLHDYLKLREGNLLSHEEVTDMFTQLVIGLDYIHSKKILHRDLKTHNILLSHGVGPHSMHILKVGDFGISKVLESHSKASTVLGTPSYLSPELCQGHAYDVHSDMWALGCILYEMLTLRKAFESTTLASLVMKIMQGYVAPIDATMYSSAMLKIVSDLLQTTPERRPTTAVLLAYPSIATSVCRVGTELGRITVMHT